MPMFIFDNFLYKFVYFSINSSYIPACPSSIPMNGNFKTSSKDKSLNQISDTLCNIKGIFKFPKGKFQAYQINFLWPFL